MNKLVIVESPTKTKSLGKYLGSDYQIMASMGHVRDLPKSKLGIEIKEKDTILKEDNIPLTATNNLRIPRRACSRRCSIRCRFFIDNKDNP